MTTITKTALSLNPVYMEVDQRGQDDKLVLVNADEIITHIVSPGHPNAAKLLEDFNQEVAWYLSCSDAVTPEQAKLAALTTLIERAYGIVYDADPADEADAINEDEEDALIEKVMTTLKERVAASKR